MSDRAAERSDDRRLGVWPTERMIISVAFTTALVFGPLVIATGFLTEPWSAEDWRLSSYELRPTIDDEPAPPPRAGSFRGD